MIFTVCAYYDVDIEKFNPPFLVPMSLEDTIDQVIDGVKKGNIKDAKSYLCYHLGFYDTSTAKFNLNKEPVKVLELASYVRD